MKSVIALMLLAIPLSAATRIPLAQRWELQSSAKVADSGAEISTAAYQASGWYPASVPATVIATLVKNKVYADPTFGMNLRAIPGTSYAPGTNFSNEPMPPGSPFAVPWWYRTALRSPRRLQRTPGVAALRRHQLPRQHLAERQEDRERERDCRRMAHLRVERDRGRVAGAGERAGGGGVRAETRRPGHHLCGLEPAARGQGHGAVARACTWRAPVRWRCGGRT